jgi:aminoglycoside phosphotransferase (APT) family kinase protein
MLGPEAFLQRHADSIEARGMACPAGLAWIAATPRFRASSHVLLFGLGQPGAGPVMVLKLSRNPVGSDLTLVREARNLDVLERAGLPNPFSVPRALVLERSPGFCGLLETGVPGRILGRELVRSNPHETMDGVTTWLAGLHEATAISSHGGRRDAWEVLEGSLRAFALELGGDVIEGLVQRTLRITQDLRGAGLPTVLEHGDLGAPNLLMDRKGGVGVVDWELADPHGLPLQDLVFFLAFAAIARSGARREEDGIRAVAEAFADPGAWGWRRAVAFADRVRVPEELLEPLMVACWARYTIGLHGRLRGLVGGNGTRDAEADRRWLLGNRYFAIWAASVGRAEGRLPASRGLQRVPLGRREAVPGRGA